MLRVEPHKMTAALLREHGHDDSASVVPRLCLADFGESVVIAEPGQALQLTRPRGTEAIKSPEMLRVTGGQHASGVGPASDVWSLGCLLFEVITEEVMFANGTVRVLRVLAVLSHG
jgi:serine/threonine protein kinase